MQRKIAEPEMEEAVEGDDVMWSAVYGLGGLLAAILLYGVWTQRDKQTRQCTRKSGGVALGTRCNSGGVALGTACKSGEGH